MYRKEKKKNIMAKKFVRGVTGIDDIESFDKTLTNVNDIISDGQNTYVHTKKGKNEFYYNVTDGVKSVESTDSTITVEKSDDGTVNLKTNPKKVLQHENLLTDYGISKTSPGNTTKLGLEYSLVPNGFDLNNFTNGRIRGENLKNRPTNSPWFFVKAYSGSANGVQDAVTLFDDKNTSFRRYKKDGVWKPWREQVGDKSIIDDLLAKKQSKLTNNTSIAVNGTGLQQLYLLKKTYTHNYGFLKTHVKSLSDNTSVGTLEEEFNFILKINKGASSLNFTLNPHNTTKFANIMSSYGSNNTVCISGVVLTLSGSNLTVSTTNNTAQNYVITFSDII